MALEHTFVLTKRQEQKLTCIVDTFYNRAAESTAIPQSMLLLLGGVRRAVLEQDPLDQIHVDVVLWTLDLILAQMKDEEIDPLLEQVYHKLAGWWPVEPAWYDRIQDYQQ